MRYWRYIGGTILLYLIIATFTVVTSGFILMDTWGAMEKHGVLRPAQGGNNAIFAAYTLLLISSFIVTFIYIRLKKAENPFVFGPLVGLLYSAVCVGNYFVYMIPNLKVPLFIILQNVLGFTFGIWIFKKTYYRK